MNVIIDDINVDKIKFNINIQLNKNILYKLYYYHNLYYKILGIPIKIQYKYIRLNNNLLYIYFDEKHNDNLTKLNMYFKQNINNFLFIRNNITNKFIICNNYDKIPIDYENNDTEKYININISKIKYIKNNNIPIINILQ